MANELEVIQRQPPVGAAGPAGAGQMAFVIDQRACIGCHACTVACKTENDVELGVFRTWVKYIEQGTWPDVRRYFSVLRCNHCTDAPCVEICPVTALYKREDGIVDFDPERCIGCKACLNGCPYDALYIDPNSDTAGKCNFCAHRVEIGLKPACEIVCPTNAIVSGDITDPDSEVSRLVDTHPAHVRAPEQGTGPNVFYLGAQEASIDPLLVGGGDAYLYNEVPQSQREKLEPLDADARARAMHDVAHPAPWGWKVSSYFLSKGIAAGAMMLAGVADDLALGVLALAGIAVTGAFLVWDLKRPERFHYLFFKPQWRSWLARGAQVMNVAALVAALWTAAALLGWDGLRDVLRWAMVPTGAALAGYTAFLFNQCEGRDLWQSPLLLPQTLVNALAAGSAGLAIAALAVEADTSVLGRVLLGGVAAGAAIWLLDLFARHPTAQAKRAALNLRADGRFWIGAAVGLALPGALGAAFVATEAGGLLALAGGLVLLGQWLTEDAWVRAGQSVPLS
jgi:Fe-S-cluster-containing dehydrogenase component/formate-dependent nitrite reductase membrane component NrfD